MFSKSVALTTTEVKLQLSFLFLIEFFPELSFKNVSDTHKQAPGTNEIKYKLRNR